MEGSKRFAELDGDGQWLPTNEELRELDALLDGKLRIEDSFLSGRDGRPNKSEEGRLDRLRLAEGMAPERVVDKRSARPRNVYLDDDELRGLEEIAYEMDLVRNGRGNVSQLLGLIGKGKLKVIRIV